jgi:hypothetical protein
VRSVEIIKLLEQLVHKGLFMYKKLTLTEIKQEAKNLKIKKPQLKHAEALKKIAQKYGFEKFEILKAKAESENGEQFILIPVIDKDNGYLQYFNNQNYKIPQFKHLKNKKIAIVGCSGAGKTSMILALHEHLDQKSTVLIDSQKASVLNGNSNEKDKEHSIFKNASFVDFHLDDIDIEEFKTIVIDEGWQVPTGGKLFKAMKKVLSNPNTTVIITFQATQDAKRFEVELTPYQKPKEFNAEPLLSFYTIK